MFTFQVGQFDANGDQSISFFQTMSEDSDVDQSASGLIDQTGSDSNKMSTIDPLVNTNNIMTAAAALELVKAGLIKPKEMSSELSNQVHLSQNGSFLRQNRASLLKAVRLTSVPDLEKEEKMIANNFSENMIAHARTLKPIPSEVDLVATRETPTQRESKQTTTTNQKGSHK